MIWSDENVVLEGEHEADIGEICRAACPKTAKWIADQLASEYSWFWSQIAIAFLLSYIYRVPGGDGVKLRPLDGWKLNPYTT